MKLTLYHHRGACSLASLIALEESGLEFTLAVVDIMGDRTAYLKTNSTGKVPALTIDDELLTENVAILYRIAAMAPVAGLFPTDAVQASQALSMMAWMSNTVHITRRQIRMPVRFTPDVEAQAKLVEAGRPKMWGLLQMLEERLGDAEWFGGDRFSVVDAYAMVFYSWGLYDEFDMTQLKSLTAWKDRMMERPTVQAAFREDRGVLKDQALEMPRKW
jgi:glutathione S-transferase